MSKFKKIIIIFLIIAILYNCTIIIISNNKKIDFLACENVLPINYTNEVLNTQNIKNLRHNIENIIGVHIYFYYEKNFDGNIKGRTNILLRKIEMKKNLGAEEYIIAFSHELCHLKYCSNNERYTMYKTFVELYNSEFKQSALNIAWEMQNGYYKQEYNCWAQIYDYLKNYV